MRFDAHLHSFLSPDSELDPGDAIDALRKKGLGCCFTDHVDYVTPRGEGFDENAKDAPKAPHDFLLSHPELYPECFGEYRADDVALGLEIGLTAAYLELNERAAAKEGLDFIIGSVHFVDGLDITNGFFVTEYEDHYRRYLEYAREMVELCGFFDSLGHIEYISRYTPLPVADLFYSDYPDEYDSLFRALIDRGKTLELNSKRLGDKKGAECMRGVLKRYAELGGKYVTVGSDAHRVWELGRNFKEAFGMADETGLTPVFYKGRKMQKC